MSPIAMTSRRCWNAWKRTGRPCGRWSTPPGWSRCRPRSKSPLWRTSPVSWRPRSRARSSSTSCSPTGRWTRSCCSPRWPEYGVVAGRPRTPRATRSWTPSRSGGESAAGWPLRSPGALGQAEERRPTAPPKTSWHGAGSAACRPDPHSRRCNGRWTTTRRSSRWRTWTGNGSPRDSRPRAAVGCWRSCRRRRGPGTGRWRVRQRLSASDCSACRPGTGDRRRWTWCANEPPRCWGMPGRTSSSRTGRCATWDSIR
ncbi:hypothetical protein KIPE111705_46880 [Kibdelosporangium persicum]